MDDYVFRIAKRPKGKVVAEEMLIEFGISHDNPDGLIVAIENLLGVLKELKTPEKVADFMRMKAVLADAKLLFAKDQ